MLPTLPHLPLKLLLPQPLLPLLLLKLNKTARAKTGDNFSGQPSLSQTRLVNTRRFLLTVIKEFFLMTPSVLREVFLLQIFPSMCTSLFRRFTLFDCSLGKHTSRSKNWRWD